MEVSGCRCSLLTSTGSMQQQAHLQVQSVLMRLAADVRKWFWMNLEGKNTDPLNRSKSSAMPWWLRSSRGPGGHVLQSAPSPGSMDRMLQRKTKIRAAMGLDFKKVRDPSSWSTGASLHTFRLQFRILCLRQDRHIPPGPDLLCSPTVAITERYTKVVE